MSKLQGRPFTLTSTVAFVACLTSWLLLAAAPTSAPYLNLDFETVIRDGPWAWDVAGSGFTFTLDPMIRKSGTQSLRIQDVNASSIAIGVAVQQFPVDLVRGKHVHVSGWIRTENVENAAAGLWWWQAVGTNATTSSDYVPAPGLPAGSTEWTRYEFDRDVHPEAVDVFGGVFQRGGGSAWFDGLEITIDGIPLEQGPPPVFGEPAEKQLDWVRNMAIPLKGPTPGEGYEDLRPLKDLVRNARIVALGEGTHGTSEFFRMKHRILEFLANEMGFTIFSIEANMPEAYRLNDYVLTGLGNPNALLKGLNFWTWNTQEVLDMILWMRNFNQSGKGRIEFTGFDMQTPTLAMLIVRDFAAAHDPVTVPDVIRARNLTLSATSGFGVATGNFPLTDAAGKSVRFSGFIKTSEITRGFAGLWWRVDGPSGVLAFDNMSNRGATGTREWTRYEINLPVASNATNINFGALHTGDGTAWFDALTVELDGVLYTNSSRFDFDFESSTPVGFSTGGNGYQVGLDNRTAFSGGQSLRMQFVGYSETAAATAASAWKELIDHFEASREMYASGGASPRDIEWAIQNARVAMQSMQMRANQVSRDTSMALNVDWILKQSPKAKVVLWAHNEHVNRRGGAMGSLLANWYGKDYLPMEFAFHEGRYNAVSGGRLGAHDASPSFPGSAEYILHRTGIPQFILDVRKTSEHLGKILCVGAPPYRSINEPCRSDDAYFRAIGAIATDGFSLRRDLSKYSDAMIFFDYTRPSALLP
jgi:erythromycin esterase-like protein